MKRIPQQPRVLVKSLAVRDLSWEIGITAIAAILITLMVLV